MSRREEGKDKARVLLCDTDLFFFYLRGGKYESQAKDIISRASEGSLELRTCSEVYDDAISAIRADNISLSVARDFVSDMKAIPHTALPLSAETAEDALSLYITHGGRRRLSYFDAFHVATSKRYDRPLLTSDKYIIANSTAFGIKVVDLSLWEEK